MDISIVFSGIYLKRHETIDKILCMELELRRRVKFLQGHVGI